MIDQSCCSIKSGLPEDRKATEIENEVQLLKTAAIVNKDNIDELKRRLASVLREKLDESFEAVAGTSTCTTLGYNLCDIRGLINENNAEIVSILERLGL